LTDFDDGILDSQMPTLVPVALESANAAVAATPLVKDSRMESVFYLAFLILKQSFGGGEYRMHFASPLLGRCVPCEGVNRRRVAAQENGT
jgi:hypothetical protein